MRFKCQYCQFINNTDTSLCGRMTLCKSCGKSIRVPNGLEEFAIIGDYEIGEKLGSGSMGTVYKAVELSLGRTVALKVLFPQYTNMKGLAEFLKEARAAAMLNHPNIVQAYAIGEADGYTYLAMPLLSGVTLKERIKRDHYIEVDEALHIIQQVAEALHYAWTEAKMIHRDVKPENIMVTDNGVVKLTDMGLAIQQSDIKKDMEISGSPSYMSPEQFTSAQIDTRSDIYSLGITLYEMLSGQLPFRAQTVEAVAAQHMNEDAIPLSKLGRQIPAMVSALVRKMMAKHPEERFQSMEDFLQQIWKIRQKTAPNTDFVPSVHTVSIRRLDYDRHQNKSGRNTESQKLRQYDGYSFPFQEAPTFFDKLKNPLVFILFIIVLCLSVIIAYFLTRETPLMHNDPQLINLRKRIELYKEMSTRPDASDDYVHRQADALILETDVFGKYPAYISWISMIRDFAIMQKMLNDKLAYESQYYTARENLNIRTQENLEMAEKVSQLERQLNSITPEDPAKFEALFGRISILEKELKKMSADSEKLRKDYEDNNAFLKRKIAAAFMQQSYFMLRVGSTSTIIDMCHEERNLDSSMAPMCDMIERVARMSSKIEQISRTGAPSLKGTLMRINDAKLFVSRITHDEILFTNPLNEIVYYDFKTFPAEDIFKLISPLFAASDSILLKYTISLRRGEVANAMQTVDSASPAYKYGNFIVNTFYESALQAAKKDSSRLLEYQENADRVFGDARQFRAQRRKLELLFREAKSKLFENKVDSQMKTKQPIKKEISYEDYSH